jgi:hypothetical protein
MLKGGCYCGAVRYEAAGTPFNESNCHCSICRRSAGAPFVAWFSVGRDGFRITRGSPVAFRSTPKAVRQFCGRCGTQLTFMSSATPAEVDINIVSLDDPNAISPKDHIHTSSRLSWVKLADSLPQYPEARASGSS